MFLPIRTEAHDGKIRMGSIAILLLCLLVHVLVVRDQSHRSDRMLELLRETDRHAMDRKVDRLIDQVGGQGAFEDEATRKSERSEAERIALELQQERKNSLMYRLALVLGDFNPLNLITHQFTHADWSHLLFNLWFFYIVGVTMEKYWGLGRFLTAYLGCGVLAALGFMILSGAKATGIPMVGASGAIAGMMGAFAFTHGDAKVQMAWLWGLRGGAFSVPSRWYLGFWVAGQAVDALLYSGRGGGVAFSAHVAGFLAGLAAGKWMPGDSFYQKAYAPVFTSKDIDQLSGPGKLDIPKAETPVSHHQDGTEVTTLLNRGMHALEHGNAKGAGDELFQAMEKAFSIQGLDSRMVEDVVRRVLETLPRADFPPGAAYAWGRKLEHRDWWQWAIRYYDAAAADFSPGTGAHSRNSSLLRAAALRLDHGQEKELGVQGLRMVLRNDADGPFAAEAQARLAAAGLIPP